MTWSRKAVSLLGLVFAVSLHLGAATVQFSPRQDIQTSLGKLSRSAIADFNGDGHPDLAACDQLTHNILIYLNDGTGHFGAPLTATIPGSDFVGVNALLSGDVNQDGKQDLIASGFGGNQADFVLLGNGDGTFAPAQAIDGSFGFFAARLLDINGDKHLDIVSGTSTLVQGFLGDGKGGFTAAPATPPLGSVPTPTGSIGFVTGLAAGNFTSSGKIDLVVGFAELVNPFFYQGNGDGSFQAPVAVGQNDVGSFGVQLDAADFNGDGKLDLLVGDAAVANIFNGHGDGTFTTGNTTAVTLALPSIANPNPDAETVLVAAADMDGDKHPDVVAADDNNYLLSVFLNDGTGTFLQPTPDYKAALDPGSGSVSTADLNGDGLPDIVVTNYLTQKISIFLSVVPKTVSTVSVTSSVAQALVGSPVTVSVQVKASGPHMPTGTVTLTSGTTSFGQQTLDSNGDASFALGSLPSGQYALTATYAGDAYNNASANTTPFTQAITDFQVGLSAATVTVPTGSTATYTVSLTPVAAFAGSVTLTCSGLPTGFACPPVTAAVNGQATSASLVVTPPTTAVAMHADSRSRREVMTVMAIVGLCGFGLRSRRKRYLPALAVLGAAALLSASTMGCSGSSQSAPYRGTTNFNVVATTTQGSVSVSHQIAATLTVQ